MLELSFTVTSAPGDGIELPLDDNYAVLRRSFWLATDQAYKGAVEAIARKQRSVEKHYQSETLPDFWKASPSAKIDPLPKSRVSLDAWTDASVNCPRSSPHIPKFFPLPSAWRAQTPLVLLHEFGRHDPFALPDALTTVHIRATGQAPDGMTVSDAVALPVIDPKNLPVEPELRKTVDLVARRIKEMSVAPVGETYSGPVLFEGAAGAQLLAELLAPQLTLPRRPISEPGRPAPVLTSDFEGRIGSAGPTRISRCHRRSYTESLEGLCAAGSVRFRL